MMASKDDKKMVVISKEELVKVYVYKDLPNGIKIWSDKNEPKVNIL